MRRVLKQCAAQLMLATPSSPARATRRCRPSWQGHAAQEDPRARAAARRDLRAPPHADRLAHILAHLDYLDEAITTLTEEVERRLAPFAVKAELLTRIAGVASRNSQAILAELGHDIDPFPSDRHTVSWVAICPATSPPASAAPGALARAIHTCARL